MWPKRGGPHVWTSQLPLKDAVQKPIDIGSPIYSHGAFDSNIRKNGWDHVIVRLNNRLFMIRCIITSLMNKIMVLVRYYYRQLHEDKAHRCIKPFKSISLRSAYVMWFIILTPRGILLEDMYISTSYLISNPPCTTHTCQVDGVMPSEHRHSRILVRQLKCRSQLGPRFPGYVSV